MTPIDQIVAAREAVVRYSLHHDFKTMHSLNETQQALLRGYHETGDRSHLHLLADALIEGGAPVHGEMLLHGLEAGHISSGDSGGNDWIPHATVGTEMGMVSRGTHRAPARMGTMYIAGGKGLPLLYVKAPTDRHRMADIEEVSSREFGNSHIKKRFIDELRSGDIPTWADRYPKHKYQDPHRAFGLEDIPQIQETE